jgi:uncharacterized membrane protein
MHRRLGRGGQAVVAWVATFLLLAAPGPSLVAAQVGLTITTPYPAVSVQPGSSTSFELTIGASQPVRAGLTVSGLPSGWSAAFTGGGSEVQAVFVTPNAPAKVTLSIDVPDSAGTSATHLTVVAAGGGESAELTLDLTPASQAGGNVSLESDYPSLRGPTDTDFQFNLTLRNDTPQQLIFNLSAQGPGGWEVSVQPSDQARAASVTVPARGTQRLQVIATPPTQAATDTYQVQVAAVAGDHQATAVLAIEVTGSVQMSLDASDQRLNTTANAGSTRDFDVVVTNSGTSPLSGITLTGRGPSQWQVTFDPASIDQLAAGETATATAHIAPSGDAVAGDYVVTMTAQTEGATQSIDVRVTVETPPIWGIIGILLIVGTLAGMVWVFRRYGRR